MERNPQEERFEIFKKRALSTKLFRRLFVSRNVLGYLFLVIGVCLAFFKVDFDRYIKEYKDFYKTRVEETHATKASPSGVLSNYNHTLNGKPELIFSYSFTAKDGNVHTGTYKTFDYDYLNKKEFALIYNVKEPSFSKVLNGDENFVLEFFQMLGSFLLEIMFFLIGFFVTIWRLRKSLKERKLLLKGALARGVLVNFRDSSIVFNGNAVNELIYAFKTKEEKIYECTSLTSIPPSCLAFSCQNREKALNLELFNKESERMTHFEAHVLYLPENPSYNCLFALIPSEPQLDKFGVFR